MKLEESIREVLEKPLIARLSVIDADGYPHTVPLWFMLDGDDIVITSFRDTAKNRFLRANPKACLVVGGDDLHAAGYLIKGDAVVEDDPDHTWMRRITLHYEAPDEAEANLAEWMKQPAALIRLTPRKVSKVM